SSGDNCRGECYTMVLGPGWAQRSPRPIQHLVGPFSQDAGRLPYHRLCVIDVDLPATSVRYLGELLAIHDCVGPGLIWRTTLDGDVLGEVPRPRAQRDRADRRGQPRRKLVECG